MKPLRILAALVLVPPALALPPQWVAAEVGRLAPVPVDLQPLDDFSAGLALDGVTLVAGAPWHDPAGGVTNDGSAWVFSRGTSGWVQEAKLSPSVHASGRMGFACAISGDTIALGAPYEAVGGVPVAGSVYVFVRNGATWSEQARITAPDGVQYDFFGCAVAVDGDTLAVGARQDDELSFADTGSVYVFVRSGGTWSFQAKLVANDAQFDDELGTSIALSGDRLIAGAPGVDVAGAALRGSAYVFARSGTTWTQESELEPADGVASDLFGTSVGIDGTTAVVGAPQHDALGSNTGAAYVFVATGSNWSQQTKLLDFGSVFVDRLGTSVDVEGDRIVAGLPYNGVGGLATGAVLLFTRSNGLWTGQVEMIGSASDGNDFLGTTCALSGNLVAGGAPRAAPTAGGVSGGEAYVFEITAPPLVESTCVSKVNSLGCSPVVSWTGFPSALNPSPFTVRCTQVINAKFGLMFYGFAPLSAPFQGGTMCVQSPVRRTPAQYSGGSQLPAADCSGTYAIEMNALIQNGLDPMLVLDAHVWAQFWMRDPASPSTTGLSNAVHFQIGA